MVWRINKHKYFITVVSIFLLYHLFAFWKFSCLWKISTVFYLNSWFNCGQGIFKFIWSVDFLRGLISAPIWSLSLEIRHTPWDQNYHLRWLPKVFTNTKFLAPRPNHFGTALHIYTNQNKRFFSSLARFQFLIGTPSLHLFYSRKMVDIQLAIILHRILRVKCDLNLSRKSHLRLIFWLSIFGLRSSPWQHLI